MTMTLKRAAKKQKKSGGDRIDGDGERAFLGAAELKVVSVVQLRRHAENRFPTAAAVASMVESLRAEGQIEPLLVRPMPGPQGERSGAWGWQIISGETRWRAARELGLESLAVRVVDATDPRALELMAICNARRVDLDPVEKARLIARLCAPIVRGGAGLTREAAAKIYGLESGAAASNLVRLLDLPEAWRERVASGAVPQSVARLLLPYVEAPRILAAISASWEKAQSPNAVAWDRENWSTRERAADEIEDLVEGATRPIEGRAIGYSAKELGTYDKPRPRLFKLTDELRASLDVVTVKIDGKPIEVATDVEAFDRLQIPLVKAAIAKSRKNARPPAEPVEDPKASAKAAADKLIERVAVWRAGVLRFRIAAALEEPRPPSPLRGVRAAAHHQRIVERLLVAAILGDDGLAGDLSAALIEAIPTGLRKGLGGPASELAAAWATLRQLDKVDPSGVSALVASAFAAVLRADDDNPRFPRFPGDYLEQLAVDLGLGMIGDLWPKLTPAELREFYGTHNAEQLVDLAAELGAFVPEGKAKATAVEILLGKGGRVPVPRILGGAKAKRKRGK